MLRGRICARSGALASEIDVISGVIIASLFDENGLLCATPHGVPIEPTMTQRPSLRYSLAHYFVCLSLIALCAGRAQATPDMAINATVWKLLYGLTDAQVNDPNWLAADDDGDGLTNSVELAAGTNPESSKSMVEVTNTTIDPVSASISMSFPSAKGKSYSLESTNTLGTPQNWTAVPAVQVNGDGTTKSLTVPLSAGVFYHVLVADLDTDGDGVSDWAEYVAGYDPLNAHTKNSPTDDHTSLTNELVKENVVTITASAPSAVQPPDAATVPTTTGAFTISRGGTLNFSTTTVPLTRSGTAVTDTDYVALPSSVTFAPKVGVIIVPVVPKYNVARQNNATVTLQAAPGAGYTVSSPSSASVVISPAGNTSGTGLTGSYYSSTATLLPPNAYNAANIFSAANFKASRTDATVDFNWATTPPPGIVGTTNFAIRWQGQVQPQYTETYYFDTKADDGVKLWVNGQLVVDRWILQGTSPEWTGAIDLIGGLLYDIKLEYFQATGNRETHLYWYSNSQVKQIIPTNRLYPIVATAVPTITSAQVVYGFVNQSFNFNVVATNSSSIPTNYSLGTNSGPLPPGLSLNATTGLINGTPTQAGDYQVAIVATNANGSGSSVLDIQILNTGNAITREIWTSGVTGSAISDIPTSLPPNSTDSSLTTLEDNTAYPDNTAKRLRGYFTPPTTGNYYFWLAASNTAELWISNTKEANSKVRRAWVNAPGTNAETWNTQSNQKSGWLSLVAGQKYYFEVLHNHGVGTATDNVAVGYYLDATGTSLPIANNTGVTPGYLLSPYDYPVVAATNDTLYATNLQPQGVATSTAVGAASLRLSADQTQAVLHFTYSGLTSPRTAYHIHTQTVGINPSQIVFDIDDIDKFHPELRTADGGYIWNIVDVGTWTASGIVSAILTGQTYLNVHTVTYPNGEIRGNFTPVSGSQTAPTLQADPGYNTGDYATDAGAARFLNQATFGASSGLPPSPGLSDLAYVKQNGYSAWIDNQFTLSASHLVPDVLANVNSDPTNLYPDTLMFNAWWRKSITAPDQLRQRVAFALSEIMVVSDTGILNNNGRILADHYDTLLDNAFGNFKDILKQVTLTPAMGLYLDMRGNGKGDLTTGLHPNENYAREIMQLFSLGLNRLWPDGTLVLDSGGNLVPTYNQDVVSGVARVFTGWNYGQDLQASGRLPTNFGPVANYLDPMVLVPTKHELGSKQVLDNVVLPPAFGYTVAGGATAGTESDSNPAVAAPAPFDTYCLNDLDKAIDNMFNNSSVGPFVCRQLIQRLVSSNPSPGYIYRVVQKFNDDGSASHVRGNMQAVIKAILLDGEARNTSGTLPNASTSGKQREPLLRLTGPARAFPVTATTGNYGESGTNVLNITTVTPHLLSSGNAVFLDFTGNSPIPYNNPTTTNYSVLSNPPPTALTFSVNATGMNLPTYTQVAGSNTLTVNTAGPQTVTSPQTLGTKVYLNFLSGGATSGIYPIASYTDASHFTVTMSDTIAHSGTVIIPQLAAGYSVKNSGTPATSTITVGTFGNHNLQVNDHVWFHYTPNSGTLNTTDVELSVASIVDEDHFTIVVPNSTMKSETSNSLTVYMLVPPPLTRSGSVAFQTSKYDVGFTEAYLLISPLNSPTVFNFYFPTFQYPGTLSAANVTTPEFQLTTDTNIITLTNTIAGSILGSSNNNGLTSYRNGGGTITMDLSPYMDGTYTSNAAIPTLVDKLGDLLTGGQLTSSTKTTIVNFVANTANFPYSSPPVGTQVRDRVRAIVHLILTSPEYAIQK